MSDTNLELNEHDDRRFLAYVTWSNPEEHKHQAIVLTDSELRDLYDVLKASFEPRTTICPSCTAIQ